MSSNPRPVLPGAYWVIPERLLAGPYPGSWDEGRARERVRRVLDAGITVFLDLTEPGEMEPYAPLALAAARERRRTIRHIRLPIPDMTVPNPDYMTRILDTLDVALADGRTVYVHCLAGLGRTGTVIGCFLVRHGMSGQAALNEIAHLRGGETGSPQTIDQHRMVLHWHEGIA